MDGLLLLWVILVGPIGILIGIWGIALISRGRGFGWAVLGWGIGAPVLPVLLPFLVWLAFGDATFAGNDAHEPWPAWTAVLYLSLGLSLIGTPIFVLFAWALSAAGGSSGPGVSQAE